MAYQGNPELSVEAQERVMSSFRQVVVNLQQGQREEAMIGLEFVLRIDPAFTPAVGLQQQLKAGTEEIDLTDILAQLEAPTTDAINEMLVEAVEAYNQRNFVDAKRLVEKVLIELPGHQEGRQLLGQINESLKVEQQVGQFLAQAREALASGDPQEAANFVMMAQALDPHHAGITATLQEIYEGGGAAAAAAEPPPPGPFDEPGEPGPGDDGLPAQGEAEWSPAFGDEVSFGDESPAEPLETDEVDPPPIEDTPAGDEVPEGLTRRVDEAFLEPAAAEADVPADDVADLFDAGPAADPGEVGAGSSGVAALVARGSAAYQSGQFLEAIDAWSRVFLEDPGNDEVPKLIGEAKKQLEDSWRQAEHLLFDAEDAVIGGDKDKALELVKKVLVKYPGHPEATELHQRLTGVGVAPAAPRAEPAAAPAAAMPDLDGDLFSEPFDEPAEEATAAAEEATAEEAVAEELSFDDELRDFLPEEEAPAARRVLGLPVRTLAIAATAVVLLAVVGWFGVRPFVGGGGGSSDDVYAMRDQADALFREGKPGAALSLVEQFEPRDEVDQQLVTMLVEKYTAALATPTPTPVPASAVEAREWMAGGLWYRAYEVAHQGLGQYPNDDGLLALTEEIEELEPRARNLHTQINNGNHRAAVTTTRDLLQRYPEQADLGLVLRRSLYNAALAELRTYNLTGAATYLDELRALEPDDDEVARVLDFIANYKARPVDMQLKVFIKSLGERSGWDQLVAAAEAEAAPGAASDATPTPAITSG